VSPRPSGGSHGGHHPPKPSLGEWFDSRVEKAGQHADKVGKTADSVGSAAEKIGNATGQVKGAYDKGRDLYNDVTGKGGSNDGSTTPQSTGTGEGNAGSGSQEGSSGILDKIQSTAGDVQSVAGEISSFAGEVGSAVADPLNWLISNGLDFLISWCQPLQDALELVTGDPDALNEAAEKYTAVGESINQLAGDLRDVLDSGLASWEGSAGDATRDRMNKFIEGVQGTAITAHHISSLLKGSAVLMQAAEDIIKGILTDFIEWLIITWLAAQAAAVPTLGASEAAAAGATAVESSVAATRASTQVNRVTSLVGKIEKVISKLKGELDDIQKAVGKFANESKAVQKVIEEKGGSFGDFVKGQKDSLKEAGNDLASQEKDVLLEAAQAGPPQSDTQIDANLSAF
jgi:uncharacterized protein YukE